MSINITVIIPVYNAAPFLRKAIESALQFNEVKEVLLIEDCSPDNSLEVCKQLLQEDERIKLFQHPNNENRGASSSRNLGLKNATQEFIAFLDADDYFLPNRFKKEKELFINQNVDGVYGAIGVHFYNKKAKKKFKKAFKTSNEIDDSYLTTVNLKIAPNNLFSALVRPRNYEGYFHLNGLTIRSSSLKKMKGYWFNEALHMHEDSDFIFRLSFYLNLSGGNLKEAVAIRGVHDNNRITNKEDFQKSKTNAFLMHEAFANWAVTEDKMDKEIKQFIINEKLYYETFQYSGIKLIKYFIVNSIKSKGYVFRRKLKVMLSPYYQQLKELIK